MIKRLTLGFILLTFMVVLVTIFFQYQMGGAALQAKLHDLKGVGILMRGLIFVGVFGYWEQLMGWFAAKDGWTDDRLDYALASRWKAAMYIVLVELLIVQNTIANVIDWIGV